MILEFLLSYLFMCLLRVSQCCVFFFPLLCVGVYAGVYTHYGEIVFLQLSTVWDVPSVHVDMSCH